MYFEANWQDRIRRLISKYPASTFIIDKKIVMEQVFNLNFEQKTTHMIFLIRVFSDRKSNFSCHFQSIKSASSEILPNFIIINLSFLFIKLLSLIKFDRKSEARIVGVFLVLIIVSYRLQFRHVTKFRSA